MNARDESLLRQAMGEAAVLPPEDPARRAVERQVVESGRWAEIEWQALLQETDCLREQLARVPVPTDLEERLLGLARNAVSPTPTESAGSWRRRRTWLIAIAASAAVALITVGITRHARETTPLLQVARLAINNHVAHLDDLHLSVTTDDPTRLREALAGVVPFEIVAPQRHRDYKFNDSLALVGGRPCKLGAHPVAYSLWRNEKGTLSCSLYQFRTADFGLPEDQPRTPVRVVEPGNGDEAREAHIWCEGRFGFVVVREHGSWPQHAPADP